MYLAFYRRVRGTILVHPALRKLPVGRLAPYWQRSCRSSYVCFIERVRDTCHCPNSGAAPSPSPPHPLLSYRRLLATALCFVVEFKSARSVRSNERQVVKVVKELHQRTGEESQWILCETIRDRRSCLVRTSANHGLFVIVRSAL